MLFNWKEEKDHILNNRIWILRFKTILKYQLDLKLPTVSTSFLFVLVDKSTVWNTIPENQKHQDIHVITETHNVYYQVDSHMADDVVSPTAQQNISITPSNFKFPMQI